MKKPILAAALALMTPAAAQQAPDIMVVLDASGSMWGQIGGLTKIEIAREAFADLSTEWAVQGSNVGLIAYGHRRKGDCTDIELISMPEAGSTARLGSLVNGLTPRGKTPLSDAVRLAAQSLRFTENAATVVLLSDGRETCSADPCARGRAGAAGGGFYRPCYRPWPERCRGARAAGMLGQQHRRAVF